jgi:hypothetical protein
MKFIKGFIAVAGLAVAVSAGAQQINNPNLITLRHDFETDPPSAPPVGPFTLGAATFSEASTGTGGPGWRLISVWTGFGRQLTDNAGISDITVAFNAPMLMVGLDVGIGPGSYQVDFLNGNTVVGSVSGNTPTNGDHFFAGWQHAAGITSVHITEPSGENGFVGGLDNVRYDAVPEPASIAALGLGAMALIRRRKRA